MDIKYPWEYKATQKENLKKKIKMKKASSIDYDSQKLKKI